MVAGRLLLVLAALAAGHSPGMRGPHHPRGRVARHTHQRPGAHQVKITQDTELLRDKQHIAEDLNELGGQIDTSRMSPEELEFHYFRLHDLDNNTKLDGLEILQAIQHVLEHEDDEEVSGDGDSEMDDDDDALRRGISQPPPTTTTASSASQAELREQDFHYFVELIDQVLAEDDLDNDGFLSYVEYAVGRQRDRDRGASRTSNNR